MPGPDRLAILNADGSFADPRVEQYLTQLINNIGVVGPGGPGGELLLSYTQVSNLPDYPTAFPPVDHGHTPAQISTSTPIGRALIAVADADELKALAELDQVDNTPDLEKPISNDVQAVLNGIVATSGLMVVVWSGGNYPTQALTPPAGIRIRIFTGPQAYTGATWSGVIDGYWPNPGLT